jgi:hypothetical protein
MADTGTTLSNNNRTHDASGGAMVGVTAVPERERGGGEPTAAG